MWPRRSSLTRSPDTLSPVYPDRPIRPLPKNRLREQLSPEQQSQIVYPPEPPSTSPLFSFPYGVVEKIDPRALSRHESHVSHCTCNGEDHVDESEDDEELIAYHHPTYRWSSPVNDTSRVDSAQRKVMAAKTPPAPASVASSADGYESFENTSNKKKRKIPVSGGGGGVHQSSLLSQELANMGIASRDEEQQRQQRQQQQQQHQRQQHQRQQHQQHHQQQHRRYLQQHLQQHDQRQLSGSGRGRFGRQQNSYASSLSAKSRGGNWKGDGTCTKQATDGIISRAIASAHQDQEGDDDDDDDDHDQPTTPTKQNNESLLARSLSHRTTTTTTTTPQTQFTFTCESDSSNKMLWPQQQSPTQNSLPRSPLAQQSANRSQQAQAPAHQAPLPQHQAPPKKTRPRRPSKEFALAERQRRLQQEYTNYHQRPTKDSMWICEFCEYEDIWGSRPEALIRQYEIKDRKERQKAEERRRLLEKAKQKNRKGKKNNVKAGKPPPPPNATSHASPDENSLPEDDARQDDGSYDDDYDDGYDAVDSRHAIYPAADCAYDKPPRAPDKHYSHQHLPPPLPLQQRQQ